MNDMSELLSVIIPVYNTSKYLSHCLDSIINQNYTNLEIICINDGSTDESDNILAQYANKDNRITVIKQKNAGLSAARNAGIRLAKGKYITFVDSDDYINPETYDLCLPLFLLDIDIIIFSVKLIIEDITLEINDEDYFQVHQKNRVEVTPALLCNENVMAWNKIYKTKIIKQNNLQFPQGLWYEDTGFYWQYMSFVKHAYFLDNQLYNYIRRSGSIMSSTFFGNERSIDSLKVYATILAFWQSDKKFDYILGEVGAKLFENAFYFAYSHAIDSSKETILLLAKQIIENHQLHRLFPQNQLIKRIVHNRLYYYNWIDQYHFFQKLFSIKYLKNKKHIYICGCRIQLSTKPKNRLYNCF